MKQLLFLPALLLWSIVTYTQGGVKEASRGFDTVRTGVTHEKIDTITYASTTVGTNRRALVYTPPVFLKLEISGVVFIARHRWR
ncbi:MAG: hypothetical protein M3040_11000 [Bacteroidota bacterium]|nr:hypothetical protein [Bacteroidota bacterium]